MKLPIALLFVLGFLPALAQPAGSNRLSGRVVMPGEARQGIITRGEAYRNRTEAAPSEEKKRIDEENQPDRNVVVVLYPLDFQAVVRPMSEAVLLQREKTFVPNVLPVTKGTTVIIENGDDFFHNVFSITPGAKFNIGRRPPGNRRSQVIERSGEVQVFCDIHPQMSATILSLDTPYFARVDGAGAYRLEGLPDGRSRVEVLHPTAGALRREIELRGGAVREEGFNFQKDEVYDRATGEIERVSFGSSCCAGRE